jgi:YVTN family beta-propeller protein
MKWLAASALLVLVGTTGCGSQYRPVINPVVPTGPASQPTSYLVVFSQPGLNPSSLPPTAPPCPATESTGVPGGYANPGVITMLDFSGDTIIVTATLGNGPVGFALDSTGANAYSENCDGTISTVPISAQLQTKLVQSSTLLDTPLTGSTSNVPPVPINALAITGGQYVVEQGRNAVAAMTGSPPALKQEIFVAPSVINMTGIAGAQRVYSISQGNSLPGGSLNWGQCATPSQVNVPGEADAIEISTNNISAQIPLGICPVYGRTSADGKRTFILNRGSGTITVINSQLNQLDSVQPGAPSSTPPPSPYLNGTGTINLCDPTGAAKCNAGPVFASLYSTNGLLVTANYDNNTISIIDTNLDIYGNDGPNFGKVLATVPVGKNPTSVSVLQDGSRVYVANQGDGSVTVVSLTTFTPTKTIPLGASVPNPQSITSTYNYPIGKVYVSGQNSPYVTVIRTDTDVVSANVLTQGNVVDVHTTSQYAGQSNTNGNTQSRSVGSGAP